MEIATNLDLTSKVCLKTKIQQTFHIDNTTTILYVIWVLIACWSWFNIIFVNHIK